MLRLLQAWIGCYGPIAFLSSVMRLRPIPPGDRLSTQLTVGSMGYTPRPIASAIIKLLLTGEFSGSIAEILDAQMLNEADYCALDGRRI